MGKFKRSNIKGSDEYQFGKCTSKINEETERLEGGNEVGLTIHGTHSTSQSVVSLQLIMLNSSGFVGNLGRKRFKA